MANQPTASNTSRKTLVILVASIALVLGVVATGVIFAVQGLNGATGKQTETVSDPWIQNGTDAAFTLAMINRNESLKKVADLALSRSKNVTILAFADEVKQNIAEWNFKLDSLLDTHGINRKLLVDNLSDHYKSLGELETQLQALGDDQFNVRFVAGLNIITRMDYGNMQRDLSTVQSEDLKSLAKEILEYSSNIGPKLGNWNKK